MPSVQFLKVSYYYEETLAKNYVFMMRELAMMIVEVSKLK
jgi:hypothetical protein